MSRKASFSICGGEYSKPQLTTLKHTEIIKINSRHVDDEVPKSREHILWHFVNTISFYFNTKFLEILEYIVDKVPDLIFQTQETTIWDKKTVKTSGDMCKSALQLNGATGWKLFNGRKKNEDFALGKLVYEFCPSI